MKKIALTIALMAGVIAAGFGQPAYMNYQGRLLDPAGQPLTNGTYALEFNIYDASNGTNCVWGPFYCDNGAGDGHAPRAVIANGRFNVILGQVDTLARMLTEAFQGNERFMEIRVNGGDPILPRQQFLSAPYALRSVHAQEALQAGIASNLVQQLAEALCPPGTIVAFGGTTIPDGWLLCDGRPLTNAMFPRLFAAIGTSWGNGTLDSTGALETPALAETGFNLPDLRGVFLRGVNSTRATFGDPDVLARTNQWRNAFGGGNAGNAVGSVQTDQVLRHDHANGNYKYLSMKRADGLYSASQSDTTPGEPDIYHAEALVAIGGNETRPVNAYVNYIIKY